MHPAFYWWSNHVRRHGRERGCGESSSSASCGPGGWGGGPGGPGGPGDEGRRGHREHRERGHGGHGGGGGDDGPFGVRRPLRFLAHKLDLSEPQIADLARILDELKIERAQADVDFRRTIAAFADALEGTQFGEPRAKEGGDQRVKSAERLRDAVVKALAQIHAVLEDDQRKRLAYLIRTGVLQL